MKLRETLAQPWLRHLLYTWVKLTRTRSPATAVPTPDARGSPPTAAFHVESGSRPRTCEMVGH